jgi:CAAX prenyl protease-like protein
LASDLDEKLSLVQDSAVLFDPDQANAWGAEDAARLKRSIGLEKVKEGLDDENSDLAGIASRCQALLDADMKGVPGDIAASVKELQNFVRHFLELEKLHEEDKINEIRPKNDEFWIARGDSTQVVSQRNQSWYPLTYSIACIASLVAVVLAMTGYLRVPFRINSLAYIVGVLGIFVWLGLWYLDDHFLGIAHLLGGGARAGFNPFRELKDNPTWMWTFLGIRFLGLVCVIPIAEEFFLRGYLVRFIEDPEWDRIPVGRSTWRSLAGVAAYAAMTHNTEIIAALAWFGMVTWMFLKTRNIWDCVIAHAITNLLLGLYVIFTDTWELW